MKPGFSFIIFAFFLLKTFVSLYLQTINREILIFFIVATHIHCRSVDYNAFICRHRDDGYAQIHPQGVDVEEAKECQQGDDIPPPFPKHPSRIFHTVAVRKKAISQLTTF